MDLKKWKIFEKLDPTFAADLKRLYLIGISSRHDRIMEKKEVPWKGGVIVTKNDDVYSVVRHNTQKALSLLGVKVTRNSLPFVPVKIDALCGIEIRAISSGVSHVNALGSDGRIYQWGQMCVDNQWKAFNPGFVTGSLENQRVVQVACGQLHTLALTEDREVYSWGNDIHGQLGVGSNSTEADPVKLSGLNGFKRKVVSIACGGWTSYALDIDGNVWSWGSSSVGALGRPSSAEQRIPLKISVRNVKKISAGDKHVLALTNDNTAYFWGQHSIHEGSSVSAPKKVDVPNVMDIGAMRGCTISGLETAEGTIYFWGFAYGQFTKKPVATRYNSFDELFHSLDPPMMLQPLEFQLNKEPVMLEKLRQRFDDNVTGDITFNVQGRVIHAHKLVLLLRSDHFNNLFTTNSRSERTRKSTSSVAPVEIADCTYSAFRTFLLYLYTDRIEPPPRTADDLMELFKLAVKYEEVDLKRRCVQQLKVFITRYNVCKLYVLGVQLESEALQDLAMDFIIPNYNSVVKTGEYLHMSNALKDRLTLDLAAEDTFVGLKRKRKE